MQGDAFDPYAARTKAKTHASTTESAAAAATLAAVVHKSLRVQDAEFSMGLTYYNNSGLQ